MNSVRSNNLSLKYKRFTTSDCKDLGIVKFVLMAKTKLFYPPRLEYIESILIQ